MNIRLNQQAKEKIKEAALVSHQSLTNFVVTSLLRVSEEALERQYIIHLSNRDRDLFLTALEEDVRPNRALRKAAERFQMLLLLTHQLTHQISPAQFRKKFESKKRSVRNDVFVVS